jgi:hypothetical protein
MSKIRWRQWVIGFLAAVIDAGVAGILAAQPAPLAPEDGLVCLLVNKNSGRCLSVAEHALKPGAWIEQGPLPEDAGAAERWTLLAVDAKTFRLRNNHTRLVMEIGSANKAHGVRAIQWHDQVTKPHQHWIFEKNDDEYVLRAAHSDLVLGIRQGALAAGGSAIQWEYVDTCADQRWILRPAYQESNWSFKDNPQRGDFVWVGPEAQECVKLEPAGLRITLPLGYADKRLATGIARDVPIKGDFEATIGFEILAAPTPADTGLGTGLFLGIDLATERNRATFTRGVRERELLTTWFELTKPDADKPFAQDLQSFASTMKTGQLRITRQGDELLYDVADPDSVYFKLVHRHAFSVEDVKQLRIGGSTGGGRAALDARVHFLRLRAPSLPGAPAPIAVADALKPGEATATRGNVSLWLLAALAVGMGATLVLGIAAWLVLRLRKESGAPAAAAPVATVKRAKK